MAEYNMTDKEQAEMLKKWWKDYGRAIAVAIVVGLIVAFGWRYWRQERVEKVQQAAMLYGELGLANSQGKADNAKSLAAQLTSEYKNTAYGNLAALWMAKELVAEKKYDEAFQKCQWVIDNAKSDRFKQIARLRAARILVFQKKYKEALNMLKKSDDNGFVALADEVKGDIYMHMGKSEEAKKLYKSAQTGLKAQGVNDPLLNMKVSQP